MEINPEDVKCVRGDTVLVKKIEDLEEQKKGSIYVLRRNEKDDERKATWKAVVVQLGPDVDFSQLRTKVKPGDVVHVDPIALQCSSFVHSGTRYVFIKDDDLMAIEDVKEEANVA